MAVNGHRVSWARGGGVTVCPRSSCTLPSAPPWVQSAHFLLIFSLLQTPKPPPGREPPKAVSIFPLLLALSGLSQGACGRHFAVVQALGPEGLYDIVVGYLRAASPKVCSWHMSWGSH